MLFRTISAMIALTITAGFLGWIKSSLVAEERAGTRIDEILAANTPQSVASKKLRNPRRHVAESLP